MIKVFTTNKDGKIELTKDELKAMLDEAYWEGYRAHNGAWVYTTPGWSWSPFTCNTVGNSMTINSDYISKGTISTDAAESVKG